MKRVTGKIAKNKEKKKISLKIVILLLILGLIISILGFRSLCSIRNIDIEIKDVSNGKESKITKEQIMELLELNIGDKLYKNFRSEIIERIEKNPYVQNVEIKRDFSGELRIIVTQRQQKYLINYAGEYVYLDKEGYILEINKENNGSPIIIGLSTDLSDLSIGNTKIRLNNEDLKRIEVINNIMLALKNNGVENKINTIDVENKEDFILQLDEENKSVHIGDGSNLNTRVLYMKKILELEKEHSGIIYVNKDLDENYVYFKEQ